VNPITANLRYTIGHKRLWIIYLGLVLFICLYLFTAGQRTNDPGTFGLGIMFMCIVSAGLGGIVASGLIETLTKPVAFTLPNHLKTVRRVLFTLEAVIPPTALFVIFISHPVGSDSLLSILVMVAVPLLGYWGAVLLAFTWRRPLGFLFLSLPLLIFLTIRLFHAFDTVQRVLIQYQIAVIPLAVAVNLLAWRLLRDSERLRDFIRRRTLGQFGLWWRTRYYDSSDLWDKTPNPNLTRQELYILERMRTASQSGIRRYVWGEIFERRYWFWFTPSALIFLSVLSIIISVILGYLFFVSNFWGYFLLISTMYYENLSIYSSSLLLCRGRRERFVVYLASAVMMSMRMLVSMSIMVLLTIPLYWIMPNFAGETITFHRLPFVFCYFPLFFVPQGLIWSALFHGEMTPRFFTLLMNGLGIFLTLNGYGLLFILGSWVFLILVSYWICKKWPLVRT
jgi:hypothetical protein